MNPRVKAVTPLKEYNLLLEFTNRELKIFDMSPWCVQAFAGQVIFQCGANMWRQHSLAGRTGSLSGYAVRKKYSR